MVPVIPVIPVEYPHHLAFACLNDLMRILRHPAKVRI